MRPALLPQKQSVQSGSNHDNYQLKQKPTLSITKPSASTILHSQCLGYNFKNVLYNLYKEQENGTHSQEKRQLTEAQVLELADKDFKAVIILMIDDVNKIQQQ